ncbi:3-hydroxyacyl-CoA dehydrogenase [Natrialba asiatica DSM 12278]|uniref:3-hydroxyacyl-CoA dehydrogenase n=1 Tax=Natrialba asiatica (strain ATCC 700177 / DSM 12278 / JCM 9576 / FERM P-10747 / NBRC 102637 / 172P1) TaxID=29540 RepID=M0AEC0_NATA1|nr:3-hydroxyacyl-CoA dehydrogenase [Natrialba asiatica DSM 12278]
MDPPNTPDRVRRIGILFTAFEMRYHMRIAVLGARSMGHGIAQVSAAAGHDVVLRDVERDCVEDGLEEIHEDAFRCIEESRGGVRGPFRVLLRSPEMAGRMGELGAYHRYESQLDGTDRQLVELTATMGYYAMLACVLNASCGPTTTHRSYPDGSIIVGSRCRCYSGETASTNGQYSVQLSATMTNANASVSNPSTATSRIVSGPCSYEIKTVALLNGSSVVDISRIASPKERYSWFTSSSVANSRRMGNITRNAAETEENAVRTNIATKNSMRSTTAVGAPSGSTDASPEIRKSNAFRSCMTSRSESIVPIRKMIPQLIDRTSSAVTMRTPGSENTRTTNMPGIIVDTPTNEPTIQKQVAVRSVPTTIN